MSPAKCFKCKENISKLNSGFTCSVCTKKFHWNCGNLTTDIVKNIDVNNVLCVTCDVKSKTNNSTMTNQKDVMSLSTLSDVIVSMQSDFNHLKSTQKTFETTLETFGVKLTSISELSKYVEDHDKRIEELEKTCVEYKQQLDSLSWKLDDSEQKNRTNNVQIDGIPLVKNENLFEVTLKLVSSLNVEITKSDITNVTRVRTANPKKIKPIICRIKNPVLVANILKAVRKNKPTLAILGLNNENYNNSDPIYINEHLTVTRKQLFFKTKQFKIKNNFEFLWVKNGKIFLKKNANSETINITASTDLSGLI